MPHFATAEDALDFAIAREEEAALFYSSLAARVRDEGLREALQGFVQEERAHGATLRQMKGRSVLRGDAGLTRLAVPEDDDASTSEWAEMDLRDVYARAIDAEDAAHQFYCTLAAQARDKEVTGIFLRLAQEEIRHRTRFEDEVRLLFG